MSDITVNEFLNKLAALGVTISRQALHQSLLDLVIEAGEARKTPTIVLIQADSADRWAAYVAEVHRRKQTGVLPGGTRYKYNLDDYKLFSQNSWKNVG